MGNRAITYEDIGVETQRKKTRFGREKNFRASPYTDLISENGHDFFVLHERISEDVFNFLIEIVKTCVLKE